MLYLEVSMLQVDSPLHRLVAAVEDASLLEAMVLIVWQMARRLAIKLVEAALAKRTQRPTEWPYCDK